MTTGTNDKPTPKFTVRELCAALGIAETVEDPNAETIAEIAERLKCSEGYIRKQMSAALQNGTMEKVRVMRTGRDGREYPATAYVIVGEAGS